MRSEWRASKMEEGLQTKGYKWPQEAGKGLETESLLGPPERASIVDALSLAQGDSSWTCNLQNYKEINSRVFEPPRVCWNGLQQLEETNTQSEGKKTIFSNVDSLNHREDV